MISSSCSKLNRRLLRRFVVNQKPLAGRLGRFLEVAIIGMEMPARKSDQSLWFLQRLVHITLDVGEGTNVVFCKDHLDRLGSDIGRPSCRLEVEHILDRTQRNLVQPSSLSRA